MKRKFSMMAIVTLVFLVCVAPLAAATVYVDGEQLNASTVNENGTTLVPLRAIFEALGATVEWDATTKTVNAVKADTEVELQIGAKTAFCNDQAVSLEVPGKIVNSSTMVPLRFVSESLGANVVWDGATKTVTITNQADVPSVIDDVYDNEDNASSVVADVYGN